MLKCKEFNEHRKLMIDEIDKGNCFCCYNEFPSINIHHLDGNHSNNKKDNLIALCKLCHSLVHRGFLKSKRMRGTTELTKENILQIRKILLMKFNNYSLEDAEDRIKYERAISSQIKRARKCAFCGSMTHLKIYAPNFITKFDKNNVHNIGIVICTKCSKNRENIKEISNIATLSTKLI